MKDQNEGRRVNGQLVGPRPTSKWMEWRAARDRRIANPPPVAYL